MCISKAVIRLVMGWIQIHGLGTPFYCRLCVPFEVVGHAQPATNSIVIWIDLKSFHVPLNSFIYVVILKESRTKSITNSSVEGK